MSSLRLWVRPPATCRMPAARRRRPNRRRATQFVAPIVLRDRRPSLPGDRWVPGSRTVDVYSLASPSLRTRRAAGILPRAADLRPRLRKSSGVRGQESPDHKHHVEDVGFIGLGRMGRPMAANLCRKGATVIAYDINPDPVRELESL